MHPAPTEDEAVPRETPAAVVVLRIVFAPLTLLYRALVWLQAAASAGWARRRWRRTCRRLGDRMNAAEIGDQFLRDRVAVARRALNGGSPRERRTALAIDLRDALESLGKSGAVAGVPVMGAEREYQAARQANQRRDAAAARSAAAAAKILPQSGRAWLELLVGCATTGGLIYLLARQL